MCILNEVNAACFWLKWLLLGLHLRNKANKLSGLKYDGNIMTQKPSLIVQSLCMEGS